MYLDVKRQLNEVPPAVGGTRLYVPLRCCRLP